MAKMFPDIVNAVVKLVDNDLLVRAQSLSSADVSVISGGSFNSTHQYLVDSASPLYVLLENPIDSGVDVYLLERYFQSSDYGAELLVLWDYDVSNGTKTDIETFNNNNNFIDSNSSLTVSLLNASTLNATTGIHAITGSFTPTTAGNIREPSSISSTGIGSNRSGDINTSTGARIYKPGTGFLVKVTSGGNDNKITLGYTWDEVEI